MGMNTYRVTFWGRLKGALGLCHTCYATVSAPTAEEATLRLYDTHEHVHNQRFTLTHIDGKPVTNDDTGA